MRIKDRLHRAFSLVALSVLSVTGLFILTLTKSSAERALEKELSQTSFLIYKIVQNVFDLNEKMLLVNLSFLKSTIRSVSIDESVAIDSDAEHHITRLTDYVEMPALMINGRAAFGDEFLVDSVAAITGGNISVLQLFPQGLLQIATNIRRADGRRAVELYYPNDDAVTEAIRAGRGYIGKAFEMNEWYIVAYEPIFVDGEPVGALHAAIKPDIDDLRKHVLDIRIGSTGSPYIVDTEGILVIAADGENENVYHLPHIKRMIERRGEGTVSYRADGALPWFGPRTVLYYRYLPAMDWIVVTGSLEREFYTDQTIITWIIVLAMIAAFGAAVLVSLRVSDNLTRSIQFLTDSMNEVKEIGFDFGNFAAVDRIKSRLLTASAAEDEIALMTETYYTMLDALEDARRQIISRHRRFREIELAKKVDDMLRQDFETLQGYETSAAASGADEAAGYYFDKTPGPDEQSWYLVAPASCRSPLADLVMMMAQSSFSSMARSMPDASGREIVDMLNGFLLSELRSRAELEALSQVALVVSRPDGSFEFYGDEAGLLVYRAGTGRCSRAATDGGAGRAASQRSYRRLTLSRGDLLVYAYAAAGGLDWLVAHVERWAGERPEDIVAKASGQAADGARGTFVVIKKH